MRNSSLVIRILLLFLAAAGLFLVFMLAVIFPRVGAEVIADRVRHLDYLSHLLRPRIEEFLAQNRLDELAAYAAGTSAYLDARITVVDSDGRVLADTEENPAYMENHADRPEVKKALAGEKQAVTRFSATLRQEMLYFASPLAPPGRDRAVLRVSLFGRAVEDLVGGLKLTYLLVIGVLTAAGTTAILAIYFRFKRALRRFSAASRRVADGDYSVEFAGGESYEVRELARSFSDMVRRIRNLIAELVAGKEETESIIASIEEGVAVIDATERIVRANDAFARLFGTAAPQGRFLWEVVRANEILELCRAGGKGPERLGEAGAGERRVLCSAARLPRRGETVLVVHDVTDLKHWETMKRELVTNVSHELGTPLTAIKGYLETLLGEETDPGKRRFLEVIERHTERLEGIARDLLLLSRLEEGTAEGEGEPVALERVLERVLPPFEEKARAKGLVLRAAAAPELPAVRGHAFRLEQVLANLLDNAVKYTERGEIAVSLSAAGGRVRLSVRDTGIGIPEADRERVFERFYVVDKSRSRALGGTGLGLSIVKHIVRSHGGEVKALGLSEGGTEFVVSLPAVSD